MEWPTRKPAICGISPPRLALFPHVLSGRGSVDLSSEESILDVLRSERTLLSLFVVAKALS
jgi:hypothetical protein